MARLSPKQVLELARQAQCKDDGLAKRMAVQVSQEHPGWYVAPYACFGLFLELSRRLNVFAPSDSCYGWYVLNGKVKPFTEAQQIADQQATPTLP